MSITIHRYEVGLQMLPIIIEGMRNSWESWEKGDSTSLIPYWALGLTKEDINTDSYVAKVITLHLDDIYTEYQIGPNDMSLAERLIKAGDDHGKYLRQIPIVMDITAPEYWWKEFDQYKVGVTTNSTSMMHVLGKQPFDRSMFSFEDMQDEDIDVYIYLANHIRDKWIKAGRKKPSPEWRAMLQVTANAWLYRRAVSANYQVLRHMYHSRKNHKQYEWRDFRAWIESLPYANLITA